MGPSLLLSFRRKHVSSFLSLLLIYGAELSLLETNSSSPLHNYFISRDEREVDWFVYQICVSTILYLLLWLSITMLDEDGKRTCLTRHDTDTDATDGTIISQI